ncbi:acyl-CoA thioester hydrolase/BAAT C-terminal domain-containing protein [Flavobacterium hydatis]|nr:acyl-CoA thioester hydrolase/BAAT C-terminal domain-containing protein [Flavobacterium hydatis]
MSIFRYFIIATFSCFVMHAQNGEDYHLQKAGFDKITLKTKKDTIVFLMSKSESKVPKPTILFAQGSLPLPVIFYDQDISNSLIPFSIKEYSEKFNFVIIARKGIPLIGTYDKDANGYVDEKGEVPLEYTKNNNLGYRVSQVQTVINYLYNDKRVKKDSIFLIGHSEGYRVACKLAESDTKIAKLVCMSADPFNRVTESILRERVKGFGTNNDEASQLEIDNLIDDYKNIPASKITYKDDIKFNNWLSYNEHMSYESLRKFKKPILVVYGSADIGSAHNDLLPFLLPKNNIKLKAYPNYSHNYEKKEFDANGNPLEDSYHWDEVFKDVVNWLTL